MRRWMKTRLPANSISCSRKRRANRRKDRFVSGRDRSELRHCADIKQGIAAQMTIELRRPELEALIMERMRSGRFLDVEDALMQALETSPVTDRTPATAAKNRTGADLIAAMQASPYRDIEIEPARYRMPVREVAF
jgi:hypothetical protein